jgi:hypothetical protein
MATNPRSELNVRDRARLSLVTNDPRSRKRTARSLKSRIVSTAFALIALILVVRFLPPGTRTAQANGPSPHVAVAPSDLKITEVQVTRPSGSDLFYLDGMVTNAGKGAVAEAAAEVDFLSPNGDLLTTMQAPMMGMAQGGVGVVGNEFARHPITPGEVRFFRVAIKNAPPQWNHEVPQLKVVAVSSPQ